MIFHDVALFIINNNYVFDSLQPHNILLSSKENSAPIKIADFGVATEIGEEGYVTSGKTKRDSHSLINASHSVTVLS